MRCPACGGTGEAFSSDYTRCQACHGAATVDTVREWLRAWRYLGGFFLATLFLSCMAGLLSAVVPSIELLVVFELKGIVGDNNFGLGRTGFLAFAFLFSVCFLTFFWCTEGGPHRPGRGIIGTNGIIGNDAATIFGALIFNFFVLAGIVLAIVYWMYG
jgi:hypothetical protein